VAAIRLYESFGFEVLEVVEVPGRSKMGHSMNKWLMGRAVLKEVA
jgi:hypothetical protein